ncbi:CPBP family intramembrane metalloprotease [Mycobacterium sp. PS03-16]|uniref:Rv0804 family intramembrane glutamic endopeptidase n=1 Tax=Mycobacterium sp. PS03-16 TaxID=2559611 RepID=UPI00107461AF|nr:CPBP family intramembrane glutamic endopeptidase [Mycobacterium sp. PS03-16]TFV57206.1 CPBP family intramembrane metalloprotease [Mycobacterium sp. PS03-16]
MRHKHINAAALAGGLVAWHKVVSPRLSPRWHPVLNGLLGTGLVALTRPRLGLRPPPLLAGLRTGAAATAVVVAVVTAAAPLPPVRRALAGQDPIDTPARWMLLRIPLGTVWAEEASFRGALAHVAADALGPDGGRLLQSAAFGLSHIADARAAGQPVTGTVLVTGLAGWVFARLAEHSGSLAAAMLAHLAVNEVGAVAALRTGRRRAVTD